MMMEVNQAELILIYLFFLCLCWTFISCFVLRGQTKLSVSVMPFCGIMALCFVFGGYLTGILAMKLNIGAFVLVFLALLIGGIIIYIVVKDKPDSKGVILFIGYAIILGYITIFSRLDNSSDYNMHLSIGQMFASFTGEEGADRLMHFLLNTVMFVPFGFLFCLINPAKYKSLKWTFVGLYASLMIETTQLLSQNGECDIADLISNTLGMALGLLLYIIISKSMKKDLRF